MAPMTAERLTPATPDQLAAYRTRHVIAVEYGGDAPVCRHCRIRVIRRASGQRPLLWRHDPDVIARLARLERGEEEFGVMHPIYDEALIERASTPDPDVPPCPTCGGGQAHFPECGTALDDPEDL